MFGFLVLNKPGMITSRTALDRVARLIAPVKAGHAGTLDPLATGVLVVGIGPATKLVQFVQGMKKTYRARFRLGFVSETDDICTPLTPVVSTRKVSREDLIEVLDRFRGTILQRPPQYSALRVQGKRAYQLARAGRSVELQPRKIQIDRLSLLDLSQDEFEIEIDCGSGTYIRALGRDIGIELGTGAVMTSLQRTAVGLFKIENVNEIPGWKETDVNFVASQLISPIEVLKNGLGLSEISLSEVDIADLIHGRRLNSLAQRLSEFRSKACFSNDSTYLGLDHQGRLIAILKINLGAERPVELVVNFARYWHKL